MPAILKAHSGASSRPSVGATVETAHAVDAVAQLEQARHPDPVGGAAELLLRAPLVRAALSQAENKMRDTAGN
jgi:hypothetical protein